MLSGKHCQTTCNSGQMPGQRPAHSATCSLWLCPPPYFHPCCCRRPMQAYLRPGLPTRCSLSNLISNTYNVPLWAEATLHFYWTQKAPSHAAGQPLAAAADSAVAGAAAELAPPPSALALASSAAPATAPTKPETAAATTMPSVPDEVMPLIPREDDAESMTVLTGQGDR